MLTVPFALMTLMREQKKQGVSYVLGVACLIIDSKILQIIPIILDGDLALQLTRGRNAAQLDHTAGLVVNTVFDNAARDDHTPTGVKIVNQHTLATVGDRNVIQRACELVELLECGDVLDGIIDIINYVPAPKQLPLEPEKINRLLGTDISKEEMVRYLNLLEVPVDGDTILVPSFRPDLNLMADIAEEVGAGGRCNKSDSLTAWKWFGAEESWCIRTRGRKAD